MEYGEPFRVNLLEEVIVGPFDFEDGGGLIIGAQNWDSLKELAATEMGIVMDEIDEIVPSVHIELDSGVKTKQAEPSIVAKDSCESTDGTTKLLDTNSREGDTGKLNEQTTTHLTPRARAAENLSKAHRAGGDHNEHLAVSRAYIAKARELRTALADKGVLPLVREYFSHAVSLLNAITRSKDKLFFIKHRESEVKDTLTWRLVYVVGGRGSSLCENAAGHFKVRTCFRDESENRSLRTSRFRKQYFQFERGGAPGVAGNTLVESHVLDLMEDGIVGPFNFAPHVLYKECGRIPESLWNKLEQAISTWGGLRQVDDTNTVRQLEETCADELAIVSTTEAEAINDIHRGV